MYCHIHHCHYPHCNCVPKDSKEKCGASTQEELLALTEEMKDELKDYTVDLKDQIFSYIDIGVNPVEIANTFASLKDQDTYILRTLTNKIDELNNTSNLSMFNLRTRVTNLEGQSASILQDLSNRTDRIDELENKTISVESVSTLLSIENPKDGLRVYVKSYHAGLGKGGGYFTYDASKSTENNTGTIINGWVRENIYNNVHAYQFGAKCDGVYDDTPHIQAALDLFYREDLKKVEEETGSVELDGTPTLYSELRFPSKCFGVSLFSKKMVTVLVKHDGNGIVIDHSSFHIHSGRHNIENLYIKGPNKLHPYSPGDTTTSTGTGLIFRNVWDSTLTNVIINGMHTGWSILGSGYNNKTLGCCEFQWNQYGIVMQGTDININIVENAKIRENHKKGVVIERVSDETSAYPNAYPTGNRFIGCYIESNTPTYQSPNISRDTFEEDGTESVAVYLKWVYETVFDKCYFENHGFDFWLEGNTSRTQVRGCRHDGTLDKRRGRIVINGDYNLENTFIENIYPTLDNQNDKVQIYIYSKNSRTVFINNTGYLLNNIHNPNNASVTIQGNMQFASASKIHNHGTLSVPSYGVLYPEKFHDTPSGGSSAGINNYLEKVEGSSGYKLHCKGKSLILLEDRVNTSSPLVIERIIATPNTVLIIQNRGDRKYIFPYLSRDISKNIILKSDYGGINLNLKSFLDTVVFFIDPQGKAIEISRNLKTIEKGDGNIYD